MNGKKYTVQDTQTGKTVTFEWNHPTDPTDSDFEEVFKAAGYRSPDQGKTLTPYVGGQMQDTRSPEARIPAETRPIIPTPKTTAALHPFSTIGRAVGLPAAGAVIDAATPQMRSLAEAIKTGLSTTSAPDIQTGLLRGGQALGEGAMAGLSALHPLGFAQFGASTEAASQASPDIRQVLSGIFNPVQTLFNPQTPFGKELAKTADIAGQVGVASLASKPELTARPRQAVADALSQSVYKIPPSIKLAERSQLLKTAQQYDITPRAKGVAKLDQQVGELKTAAEGLEKSAIENNNGNISMPDMLNSIDAIREKWSKSDTPKDFIKVLDNYKTKVLAQQKPELSIQDAIDLKRNLQDQLSKVYAQQMKINPTLRESVLQEAKSSLENAVRSKLEDLIPGYKDVNSQIHKLLKLKPFVEQAAGRVSNQELARFKMGDLIFGSAGYGLEHGAMGSAAGIVIGRILTDPRVQAYWANKISPQVKPEFKPPVAPTSGVPRGFFQSALVRSGENVETLNKMSIQQLENLWKKKGLDKPDRSPEALSAIPERLLKDMVASGEITQQQMDAAMALGEDVVNKRFIASPEFQAKMKAVKNKNK